MNYIPGKHHRRSIRLNGYNYTKTGVYFSEIAVNPFLPYI
jgi:hypothetical protein